MPTVEQSVKAQFAKVFTVSDWTLFKKIADANLQEAAKLRKSDIKVETDLKLLARNARKRLLIGVGVELLLKAIYLKYGYRINKPKDKSSFTFPFLIQDVADTELLADETFTLNDLIENLHKVIDLRNKELTKKGLRVAKVFRNKEGHVVTEAHRFDASNYTDIASSLVALYAEAFSERLAVRFSLTPNEKALWKVSHLPRST